MPTSKWEDTILARVKRLRGSYYGSSLLEEMQHILCEETDVADYWTSMGDDKEKLIAEGKKQGLDFAIKLIELVAPSIDDWTWDIKEEAREEGKEDARAEIRDALRNVVDDLE